MLKNRLIACLVVKDGIAVQSINFKKYLPIGDVITAVEFLNYWGVDEIALLDIDATKQNRRPNFRLVEDISKKCFVPLMVGGGIKSVVDIRQLIQSGADKVSINSAALRDPGLIKEASSVFGNQCIVASIDAGLNSNGRYEVFLDSGNITTGRTPVETARQLENLGAGEIFLNSIDRDGSKRGYDIDLIRMVSNSLKIPVIACGGVGHPQHLVDGINLGLVSSVAAGNYFNFSEHNVIIAKSYMLSAGIDVRLDTYANYQGYSFNQDGRINKKGDIDLEQLRFIHYPKEVI